MEVLREVERHLDARLAVEVAEHHDGVASRARLHEGGELARLVRVKG